MVVFAVSLGLCRKVRFHPGVKVLLVPRAPAARAGWASPVGFTSAACSTPAVCSGREHDSTVCSQQPVYFRAGDTLGLGCSCEHVLRCRWRFISAIDRLFSERETQAASAALLTMRKLCPVQAKGGKRGCGPKRGSRQDAQVLPVHVCFGFRAWNFLEPQF